MSALEIGHEMQACSFQSLGWEALMIMASLSSMNEFTGCVLCATCHAKCYNHSLKASQSVH